MKPSLRYPLALVCLILAAYCFLREAGPVWTIAADEKLLDFSSDSQTFWTYRDEYSETLLQQRDIATRQVLRERRYHHVNLQQTSLSQNGHQVISHHVNPRLHYRVDRNPTWLLDLVTGDQLMIGKPEEATYSLSPSSHWLLSLGHNSLSIIQRLVGKVDLTLNAETDSDEKLWTPCSVRFSPDEKMLAVAWNENVDLYRVTASEIRLYDTSTWGEMSRYTLPPLQRWDVDRWDGNGLCITAYQIIDVNPVTNNEVIFTQSYHLVDSAGELSKPSGLTPLFQSRTHSCTSTKGILSVEENKIVQFGTDWHAVETHLRIERSGWMVSLSQIPIFSRFMSDDLCSFSNSIGFYQTSTNRKLNSINITQLSDTLVSPNGQWLLGTSYPDQLALYSTAPLTRWPAYPLIVMGLVTLFWRPQRTVARQRPEPA